MEQRILGDKKRVRYDEGLVDIVNKKYSKEPITSNPNACDQCGCTPCETNYLCQCRRYYESNPGIKNESQYGDERIFHTGDPRLNGKAGFDNKEDNEEEIQKKIHETLARIIDDYHIYCTVKDNYKFNPDGGCSGPIKFAEGRSPDRYFSGYSHLEIDPEEGPKEGYFIVIRELDFMADHGDETHDSKYKLYARAGKVFFKNERGNELDAAKTVRHLEVSSCNVDLSKAQTAESITKSLNDALAKIK